MNRIIVLVALVMLSAAPGFCELPDNVIREDPGSYPDVKTTEGNVTSVSADGGAFTVNPFDAKDTAEDEITMNVMPDTEVYKAGKKINASDLQVGDVVSVEYDDDRAGAKAKTVEVQ